MLLGHAGVSVTELSRDHTHRHPAHGQVRSMGMTQDMEIHRRRDFGPFAGIIQGPLLVGGTPTPPSARKNT